MCLKGSKSIGSARLAHLQDMAKGMALGHTTAVVIALSKRLLAHTLQGLKEVVHALYLLQVLYIDRGIGR